MNKPSQSIAKHHMRYNIVVLSAILAVFLVITMLQAYFTWTAEPREDGGERAERED